MANFVFNIAKGRVAELYNRVTTNDPANSALVAVVLATAGLDAMVDDTAFINSSTGFTTQNWLAPQGTGVSAITDRTGNINIAATMKLSFDMGSANAADSFDLIAYKLSIEF